MLNKEQFKILLLGLREAGKTAILYLLKLGEQVKPIPTIGYNSETIIYKGISFNLFELGGEKKFRSFWKHYYHDTQGIIFVVDSNDETSLEEAGCEFRKLAFDESIAHTSILVMANKQDLSGALSPKKIAEIMEINQIDNHKIKFIKTSVVNGTGFQKAFDWFVERVKHKKEEMNIEEQPIEYDSSEE